MPKKIHWKRIAAEGAAVVVSILIAFSIDAWWQQRSERIALVEYLVQFESEVIAIIGSNWPENSEVRAKPLF